jgi:arabinan endo-1,5-alpha-L-arabinosidase
MEILMDRVTMNRRRFLQSTGAVSGGSILFGRSASSSEKKDERQGGRYWNPVFEPTFADPSIVRGEEYFYAYGTSDDWHDGEEFRHGPVIRSPDLVRWEYVGELFDDLPGWLDDPDFLWAPDVAFYDDQYYVYYSLVDWGGTARDRDRHRRQPRRPVRGPRKTLR